VKVVNIRSTKPLGSMLITRGTKWGNPFIIGVDGTREEVIEKFRKYALWRLKWEPEWLSPLKKASALVCYCSPLPCHGDVIVELLQKKGGVG
jgi:hypothetical protein